MKKMKSLMIITCLFLSNWVVGQNLILNSDFELGNIPVAEDLLHIATNWTRRPTECNFYEQSPDLFDSRSTSCKIGIPTSKWASNIPVRVGGNRYVGLSSTRIQNNQPTHTTGETIRGSILPLSNTCGTYDLNFYVHTIDGWPIEWSSPCFPANTNMSQNAKVEVYLVKSGSCTRKLIYSSPIIYGSSSWQLLSTTFTLTPSELAIGYDKIDIETKGITNEYGQDVGGTLFMDDFSLTADELTPSLTGNTSFCDGDLLTFNGSTTQGIADNHYWAIVESDAAGNPVPGGFSWNSWYTGNPSGNYTFPSNLSLDCNKYYRVKLAVSNDCVSWNEETKVIYINCLPSISSSFDDVTLCANDEFPVVLFAGTKKGHTYNWTYNGGSMTGVSLVGTIIGNGYSASVNLEGTYCVSSTSNSTGCSASDCAIVQYDPRLQYTPEFEYTATCSSSSSTFDVVATFDYLPAWPDMCYTWKICEVDINGNNISCLNNPSMWWGNTTTQEDFTGYTFEQGKYYVIKRGIFSCQDDCVPITYHSSDPFTCTTSGFRGKLKSHSVSADEAVSPISDAVGFNVYPNPTKGTFKIQLNASGNGQVQVLDYTGRVILEKIINGNSLQLDISEMPSGLYFVQVVSEGKQQIVKIIKE